MANDALGFPFGRFTNDNQPQDAKYFNRFTKLPYASVAEVMSVLPIGVRVGGLTVNVAGIQYWWLPNDTVLTETPVIKNEKGDTGATGSAGTNGLDGAKGDKGDKGTDYVLIEINKTGINVDSATGDLDLSAEIIPSNPRQPTVYVNDIAGSYATQYNKSTKIISGLYGVAPSDTIQIIF